MWTPKSTGLFLILKLLKCYFVLFHFNIIFVCQLRKYCTTLEKFWQGTLGEAPNLMKRLCIPILCNDHTENHLNTCSSFRHIFKTIQSQKGFPKMNGYKQVLQWLPELGLQHLCWVNTETALSEWKDTSSKYSPNTVRCHFFYSFTHILSLSHCFPSIHIRTSCELC